MKVVLDGPPNKTWSKIDPEFPGAPEQPSNFHAGQTVLPRRPLTSKRSVVDAFDLKQTKEGFAPGC